MDFVRAPLLVSHTHTYTYAYIHIYLHTYTYTYTPRIHTNMNIYIQQMRASNTYNTYISVVMAADNGVVIDECDTPKDGFGGVLKCRQ